MKMRIRLFLTIGLLFIVLVSGSCSVINNTSSGFESRFKSIVQPYTFDLLGWEIKSFFTDLKQRLFDPPAESTLNSQSVIAYFSYMAQINTLQSDIQSIQSGKSQADISQYQEKLQEVEAKATDLQETVEKTIAAQIDETLVSLGIYNPIYNNFKFAFPTVNFKLEKPLYVLIVSPRDKIEKRKSVTIDQNITPGQMQSLESLVDDLNVSSLVVQIGGLGATYPSFVINNADLRWTIDTAAHEWVHQYLAFKPMGFRYVLNLLGLSNNNSISTLNETAASIIGKELGSIVYNRYYPQYQSGSSNAEQTPVASTFDFNAAMRDIRKNVNSYLAQGQVGQAEEYMETQRQFLETKGYYLRKLNQAYFAFYGSYADSPASIDPVGTEMQTLRQHSLSLKDFLDAVSGLTSAQDLNNAVIRYK
jgi:hypothetical protein